MPRYFLYGTLCHPPLRDVVIGAAPDAAPARLEGHRVHWAKGQSYPVIVAAPRQSARGVVVEVSASEAARLDLYEGAFGYDAREVTVEAAGEPVRALCYMSDSAGLEPGARWSHDDWAGRWGDATTLAAIEFMRVAPGLDPAALRARYPMMLARADSRLRAQCPRPTALRREAVAGDVVRDSLTTPYAFFFAVEEEVLRFRRFGGEMSAPVRRASFIMADAVTVLPYDPARDRVLLVEQFRAGPHARGDANPWCLEPIAGRIDIGESPEAAARRETLEEARLDLRELLPVGRYYPSPGAVTEYLFSYVGLADLPDGSAGIAGLETEGEDIRSHVIGFDRLMRLVDEGEAETGPLLVSALWLARARDRLRAAAD